LSAQPEGYYLEAEGKTGVELQEALHQIIDDHTVLSYSALWSAFQSTDKKDDGSVWDMYSDIPGGSPAYTYTFVSDQCGNYSGEGSCYNREHSFPKSWFNDGSPMYTDLFHLYPTDGWVNGKRSNYPFGETDNPNWTSTNGSKLGPCSVNGYTGTIFEPLDEYKGDFARTYFYMATRYYEEDAGWAGSPMVDGAQPLPWAREMLVRWHTEDPVSQKERDRNEAVYALQGNRNPYIDHPEYVSLLYTGASLDELAPVVDSITVIHSQMIRLWFNEPLSEAEAETTGNYSITGGVEINGAVYNSSGATIVDLSLSTLQNGSYSITINGVKDTADNVMVLAVYHFEVVLTHSDIPGVERLRIFPNPNTGAFYVKAKTASGQVPLLIDLSGRPVSIAYHSTGDITSIETNAVPGIYFLYLSGESGRYHAAVQILHQ